MFLMSADSYFPLEITEAASDNSDIQSTVGPDNPKPPLQALAYRTTARHTTRRTTPRPSTTRRRTTPRPTTHRTTESWIHATPRSTTRRTTTPRPTTRRTTTPRHTTHRTTQSRIDVTPRSTTRRTTHAPTTRPWINVVTSRLTTRHPTTPYRKTTSTTTYRPKTTTTHRRSTTTYRPISRKENVFVDLPPPPGSGQKPGKTKITIVNQYNYHYPGFYTVPVAHNHYPGYYQTYSSYHYAPSDTGSGILGFYLGYQLAKLTTPTYSHQSFYDGYRPRYDHYTVHHYYHNSDVVPKQQNIVSNAIVGCVGDSTTVCPTNTTSLCTSDGILMCVVPAENLVSCTDVNNKTVSCTRSTISCVNNTAPECATNNSVVVNIPCVSTAKIQGDIEFVNNTIVTSTGNCTLMVSCVNSTAPECAKTNSTNVVVNVPCDNTTSAVNCTNTNNTTCASNGTTQDVMKYVNNPLMDLSNETTTPSPTSTTSVYWKWKRSVPSVAPQEFCVTVVAMPARRVPTEGEKFLSDAKSILRKFIEAAWNL